MSKRKMTAGQTSVSLPIFIQDTTSTTGGGLGGIVSGPTATTGLVLEYRRRGEATWTSVPLATKSSVGTFVSGGICADGALVGAYEVDFPDAAFATGARWVALRVRGVANMLPVLIEVELDAVDYQDSSSFGLSILSTIRKLCSLIPGLS